MAPSCVHVTPWLVDLYTPFPRTAPKLYQGSPVAQYIISKFVGSCAKDTIDILLIASFTATQFGAAVVERKFVHFQIPPHAPPANTVFPVGSPASTIKPFILPEEYAPVPPALVFPLLGPTLSKIGPLSCQATVSER